MRSNWRPDWLLAALALFWSPLPVNAQFDDAPDVIAPEVNPRLCNSLAGRVQAVEELSIADHKRIKEEAELRRVDFEDFALQRVNLTCAIDWLLEGGNHLDRPELVPTRFWAIFGKAGCSAGRERSCVVDEKIVVPDGYQICRVRHGKPNVWGDGAFSFTPIGWFKDDDPKSAPRFRGYRMRMSASGSDGKGSGAFLPFVTVEYFIKELNNEQRVYRSCDMPNKAPPPPLPKLEPSASPGKNTLACEKHVPGNDYATITVRNNGGTAATSFLKVTVEDAGYQHLGPSTKFEGLVTVPPGQVWRHYLHQWRARNWRCYFTSN